MTTNDETENKGLLKQSPFVYSEISDVLEEGQIVLLSSSGSKFVIPGSLVKVMQDAVAELSRGRNVEVVTSDLEITTQDAADYLGISRPTFVQLLRDGKLPYTQAGDGKHRRIRISDLVAYQKEEKTKRDTAFAEFLRLGQEMQSDPNYVEPPMEEIIRIIKEIRKENAERGRAKGND